MQLTSIGRRPFTLSIPNELKHSVENYEKLNRIGEGTYGIVYRARHTHSKKIFALKKIRMNQENEGLPISSLREISLLRQLNHRNIVAVIDVVVGSRLDDIFMVMEYCEQDMAYLLDNITASGKYWKEHEVKCLMKQLFKGLHYLHQRSIIHRDLKMSNLLLTGTGILKIADFGLARKFSTPPEPMTPKVVTLWYRAPELLFGEKTYTKAIDLWSSGAIFGELILGVPLLPGKVEMMQMKLICDLLGSPNNNIWPDLKKLPLYTAMKFPDNPYSTMKQRFPKSNEDTVDLIEQLLTYDPNQRISVSKAMDHDYFRRGTRACDEALLPTFPEFRNLNSNRDDGMQQRNRGVNDTRKLVNDERMKRDQDFFDNGELGVPIVKRFRS